MSGRDSLLRFSYLCEDFSAIPSCSTDLGGDLEMGKLGR